MRTERAKKRVEKLPIKHWSHSSLMAFLRNPLTWYKRYVEEIYDMPSSPSSIVGRAGHLALQHFYQGVDKEASIALGLEYLRGVSDSDIDFGKAKSRRARRDKRPAMEREYVQAVNHYLAKPPKHDVVGVEVKGVAAVEGLPLPLKAISDLVVKSRVERGALDIIDHKFVASFSKNGRDKTLFVVQALFNYYTVRALYGKPVRRFIVYECKKSKSVDGRQMRRYAIDFTDLKHEFSVFHRLLTEATEEVQHRKHFLPNPSDMFEGDHSFDLYRLRLISEGEEGGR